MCAEIRAGSARRRHADQGLSRVMSLGIAEQGRELIVPLQVFQAN